MRKVAILLTWLLCAITAQAWPINTNSVTVPVGQQVSTTFSIPQGETRVLEALFVSGSSPASLTNMTVDYLYKIPEATNWWTISGSVNATAGVARVTWGPAYDTGAPRYEGWLRLLSGTNPIYRIKVDLTMISTPGFVPNTALMPAGPILNGDDYTNFSGSFAHWPFLTTTGTAGVVEWKAGTGLSNSGTTQYPTGGLSAASIASLAKVDILITNIVTMTPIVTFYASNGIAQTVWVARVSSAEGSISWITTNIATMTPQSEFYATNAITSTNWQGRMSATEGQTAIALTNWLARMGATEGQTAIALTNWTARMSATEGQTAIALTNWLARMGITETNYFARMTQTESNVGALFTTQVQNTAVSSWASNQAAILNTNKLSKNGVTGTNTTGTVVSDGQVTTVGANTPWTNACVTTQETRDVSLSGSNSLGTVVITNSLQVNARVIQGFLPTNMVDNYGATFCLGGNSNILRIINTNYIYGATQITALDFWARWASGANSEAFRKRGSIAVTGVGDGYARSEIYFANQTDLENPTEKMRLNWMGNLGIATNTPIERLHVIGNILTPSNIILQVSNMSTLPTPATNKCFIFTTNTVSAELCGMDGAGNVTVLAPHEGLKHMASSYNVWTGEGRDIDLDELAKGVQRLLSQAAVKSPAMTNGIDVERIYSATERPRMSWEEVEAGKVREKEVELGLWLSNTNEDRGPKPIGYTPNEKPKWLKQWEAEKITRNVKSGMRETSIGKLWLKGLLK